MGATWIAHVKKVYAAGKSKGMTYKQAMVEAKKTWKKGATAAKKGKAKEVEAVEEEDAPKKKRRRKKKSLATKTKPCPKKEKGDDLICPPTDKNAIVRPKRKRMRPSKI